MTQEIVEELSLTQRIKRGHAMRKIKHKLKRGRDIRKKRMATGPRLQKRAERAALSFIKKKFAGKRGENYRELSPSAKMQVDKIVSGKKGPLKNIARRMLPDIRKKERDRLKSARAS